MAIAGLAVSLFGNWIQYQSLAAKKTELQQSQEKLDAASNEIRLREASRTRKRGELEARLHEVDQQIETMEMEKRRGGAGLMFAPADQKAAAMQIIKDAEENEKTLEAEKKKLQDKIDALPTD